MEEHLCIIPLYDVGLGGASLFSILTLYVLGLGGTSQYFGTLCFRSLRASLYLLPLYVVGLGGASGFNAQNLAALQQLAAVNNATSCGTGLSGLNSATGKH